MSLESHPWKEWKTNSNRVSALVRKSNSSGSNTGGSRISRSVLLEDGKFSWVGKALETDGGGWRGRGRGLWPRAGQNVPSLLIGTGHSERVRGCSAPARRTDPREGGVRADGTTLTQPRIHRLVLLSPLTCPAVSIVSIKTNLFQ